METPTATKPTLPPEAEIKTSRFKQIFSRRNRLIALIICMIFLLGIEFIPGAKQTVKSFAFSIAPGAKESIISLHGTPAERGKQYGEKLDWSVSLLANMYIYRLICRNDQTKYETRSKAAKALFDKIDPRWTTEVTAVAKGAGVEPKLLMIGNTFLDLGFYLAACRQVIIKTPKGTLHAHNLDWDNLAGFGNFLVTVFRTKATPGRLDTVHLAFPGMIGALDIINEKGIALSFDQVGISEGKSDMPIFIKMRDIAETCSTFAEAKKEILAIPIGVPFCIGLSDSKTGETAIFEREDSTEIKFRLPNNGILTADNAIWCGRDMSRCAVDSVAHDVKPKTANDIKKILRDESVLLDCNIYSVIFDFPNNKFYIAAGNLPAAKGTYHEYPLFENKTER